MTQQAQFAPPRFTSITQTTRQLNASLAEQLGRRGTALGRQQKPSTEAANDSAGKDQKQMPTSSQEIVADLDQLQQQLQDCRRVTSFQQQSQNKYTNLQLEQMLPIGLQQKQENDQNANNQSENSITSLDALNLDKMTPQERVAELRKHPELLRAFMEEQRRARANVRASRVEDDYRRRLAQRALLSSPSQAGEQPSPSYAAWLSAPGPAVKSFVAHNKRQNPPETRVLALKQRAICNELKNAQVLAQKDLLDADFERRALIPQLRPIAGKLLPQTFILQRNRLLTIAFLTARIALLHDVCAVYAEVHASNSRIQTAAELLQREFRRFAAEKAYRRVKDACAALQRAARGFIVSRHARQRKSALLQIKDFLLAEYFNNTALGAAARLQNASGAVLGFLTFCNRRKIARKALIQQVFDAADREVTLQAIRKKEYILYNNNIAKMLADPKQRRAALKMPTFASYSDPKFAPEITAERIEAERIRANQQLYVAVVELIYQSFVRLNQAQLSAQWKTQEFVIFTISPDFARAACEKAREIDERVRAAAEEEEQKAAEAQLEADGEAEGEEANAAQQNALAEPPVPTPWAGWGEFEQFLHDSGRQMLDSGGDGDEEEDE